MRVVMMVAALAALGACNRSGGANNSASAPANTASTGSVETNAVANAVNSAAANSAAPQTAAAFPENFPDTDPDGAGADCVVYLGLAVDANSRATGSDIPAMRSAADRWRADVQARLGEEGSQQLIGSNVNPRMDTPAAQRDAAARWCVEHAPAQRGPAQK